MSTDQEQFDEAVNDRAEELYYDERRAAEWVADVADEDAVFEFARAAFAAELRSPSALKGGGIEWIRARVAVRLRFSRLDLGYANWCEERAREGLLREASEADAAAADDECDRRREEGMSS